LPESLPRSALRSRSPGVHRVKEKRIELHVLREEVLSKAANSRFGKKDYARKKAAGICAQHGCAEKTDGGHSFCGQHRAYFRVKAELHRAMQPERILLAQDKKRSKLRGTPFNLILADIFIPDYCPVLGIKLQRGVGVGGAQDSSPSVDCCIPRLGYIRGNVAVISYKANRIKTDATLEELERVVDWVKSR